jgi:hypothetical protein
MKVFPKSLHILQVGSPVTPEVYNTNISQIADSNNDIASKRYTRWSTVYQYGGYNNTFSTEVLKFKIPPAIAMTSGLGFISFTTSLAGDLAVGSFRDIKFGNNGASVFVLGREFPAGFVTTFVKYDLSINYDMSTIDVPGRTTYTFPLGPISGADGFYFSSDGLKLFVVLGGAGAVIKELALASPWDLSTVGALTMSLGVAANTNYISFAEQLQNSPSTDTLYYGEKGSTTIYKRDISGYNLVTVGAEVAIVPVPNDPIYGVYAADDGDNLLFTPIKGLRTVLTFVNYAAGSTFIRAHTSTIAASDNINIFGIGNYRNLKMYNATAVGAFHASKFGNTCLSMSTNGLVRSFELKNSLLHSPVTGIERIIISGYYTAANPITLTVSGDGLSGTYNIILPASTDNLERRFDFDGKKINIIDSVSTSTPTINIASTGIYNIDKLDVELHFVSDRLANHFSSAVPYTTLENQTGIISLDSNDYITENEAVLAAKVNTSKRKVGVINRQNVRRDSSFRWVHYSALNISSAAAHIFELPSTPGSTASNNTNNDSTSTYNAGQVITGFYIAISTIGGGVMNIADTISINSGANFKQTVNLTATNNQQINFQPTISGVLPAPFFGSAEQINGSLPVPGATWDSRFFTISTTSPTALKVQVYLMYA